MIFAMITEKWKKGNVTHRDQRESESESAFFALSLSSKTGWLQIVRLVSSSSSSAKNARALYRSREAKKFQKFHSSHAPIFFLSLFLLFGKIREKIASQHTEQNAHRAFFLVCAPFVCFTRAIYIKRERQLISRGGYAD